MSLYKEPVPIFCPYLCFMAVHLMGAFLLVCKWFSLYVSFIWLSLSYENLSIVLFSLKPFFHSHSNLISNLATQWQLKCFNKKLFFTLHQLDPEQGRVTSGCASLLAEEKAGHLLQLQMLVSCNLTGPLSKHTFRLSVSLLHRPWCLLPFSSFDLWCKCLFTFENVQITGD